MRISGLGTFSVRCLALALALAAVVVMPAGRDSQLSSAAPAPTLEQLAGRYGWAEAFYMLHGYPDAPPQVRQSPVQVTPSVDLAVAASEVFTHTAYLPLVVKPLPQVMVERRGLWVTRYDWTTLTQAPAPEAIDAIVANAAHAHFNALFFQVRGAGDAYYTPGLEPWSARLSTGVISETLGLDPGWDPLQRLVEVAHAAGLEVHAYVNVYPAWLSPPSEQYGQLWPPATTPPQMFDLFTYGPDYSAHPGQYALGYTWRHYDSTPTYMPLAWNQYLWASPGVDAVQDHIAAVVNDIVTRYAVDGVHLDLVRYAGYDYSYDPFSNAAAGPNKTLERDQWQRDRVTALVQRIADQTHARRPGTWVTAAVWPYYIDLWGWGLSEGYSDYYQDSKGWLVRGAVDAIAPMLYGSVPDDFANWKILAADFIDDSAGRPVYPGIGAHYDNFGAIADRIEAARQMGASGHILFSYGAIDRSAYWDDLLAGPYRQVAQLPALP